MYLEQRWAWLVIEASLTSVVASSVQGIPPAEIWLAHHSLASTIHKYLATVVDLKLGYEITSSSWALQ